MLVMDNFINIIQSGRKKLVKICKGFMPRLCLFVVNLPPGLRFMHGSWQSVGKYGVCEAINSEMMLYDLAVKGYRVCCDIF